MCGVLVDPGMSGVYRPDTDLSNAITIVEMERKKRRMGERCVVHLIIILMIM